MLNTATSASHYSHSHTTVAQPAAVGMSLKHSPLVAATGSGADGPACCSRCRTPVSATPVREGNTERIANSPHPRSRAEGASANPQVHSRGSSTGITHGGIPRLQPCGGGQVGAVSPRRLTRSETDSSQPSPAKPIRLCIPATSLWRRSPSSSQPSPSECNTTGRHTSLRVSPEPVSGS